MLGNKSYCTSYSLFENMTFVRSGGKWWIMVDNGREWWKGWKGWEVVGGAMGNGGE